MNENNQNNGNDFRQNAENFTKEASEKFEQFANTAKREGGPILSSFMSFDRMISTKIIKVLYVLGMIGVILSGLGMILTRNYFTGERMILQGLATIIIGPLMVRVWAELMIVLFNINENLGDIKRSLGK
ncbi:MAG: DUF4282 domain-containing protein [Peptostreptococcaceae bacterium]|nr:DUF4282 domain-containing protein [Peptostreptococcaceae bacterium]